MSGGIGTGVAAAAPGTTLQSIINSIRRRLGDTQQRGTTTDTGDGSKVSFKTREAPFTGLVVTVDGDVSTAFTSDSDSGWVTFTSAPTAGDEIVFTYLYHVWSNDHITAAVNDAVNAVFGYFYVEGEHADIATTGAQEYTLQDSDHDDLPPSTRITKVEYWATPHWARMEGWSTRNTPTTKVLHFESAPASGYVLRVSYQSWPACFASLTDTLEETVGLDTRAKSPIILFSMSSLLGDRLGARIRGDLGHNSQNENQIKSYEIQNDAAWFRSQAELEARKLRQPPLRSRIVT